MDRRLFISVILTTLIVIIIPVYYLVENQRQYSFLTAQDQESIDRGAALFASNCSTCHGSTYNLHGEWVEGPAPRGMDRFKASIADGNVMVDTTNLVTGPPHGTHTIDDTPRGPRCA